MLYKYDLHIHSALSPCADNDMTPVNIVGTAKLLGLDYVAIADHNAIGNVKVAILAGIEYGIKVVPAFELQTNEDVHILCLFKKFESLENFYNSIKFSTRQNRKEIFGEQLLLDEDDNVIGEEQNMLLDSAQISSEDVPKLVDKFDGVAIPAHIDRDMNGMLQMLGAITDGYDTVEISNNADNEFLAMWKNQRMVIIDSDAHTLNDISTKGEIELKEYSIDALIEKLKL